MSSSTHLGLRIGSPRKAGRSFALLDWPLPEKPAPNSTSDPLPAFDVRFAIRPIRIWNLSSALRFAERFITATPASNRSNNSSPSKILPRSAMNTSQFNMADTATAKAAPNFRNRDEVPAAYRWNLSGVYETSDRFEA